MAILHPVISYVGGGKINYKSEKIITLWICIVRVLLCTKMGRVANIQTLVFNAYMIKKTANGSNQKTLKIYRFVNLHFNIWSDTGMTRHIAMLLFPCWSFFSDWSWQ